MNTKNYNSTGLGWSVSSQLPTSISYGLTYYCSECEKLRNALSEEKQKNADLAVDSAHVCDHLRYKYDSLYKEYLSLKAMRDKQATTIHELRNNLINSDGKVKDTFGYTFEHYQENTKNMLDLINKLDEKLLAYEAKRAQTVELVNKIQSAAELDKKRFEERVRELNNFIDAKNIALNELNHSKNVAINELNSKIKSLENRKAYCCECDSECAPANETIRKMSEQGMLMQRQIEDQNRIIGAKNEMINNLKIALNKAKTTQVVKQMPDYEIVRAFEDKIRRLLDIANSKDEIITELQNAIATKK